MRARCCVSVGPASPIMATCGASAPAASSPSTSSAAGSLAKPLALPRAGETTPQTSGPTCCASSPSSGRDGCWARTSLASAWQALTGSAPTLSERATPHGRSMLILRHTGDSASGGGSSSWPTPTAKANHDAPSMQKWPAYRAYQRDVGRTTPLLWEWMMGFPRGWTACAASAAPSRHSLPSSSAEPSCTYPACRCEGPGPDGGCGSAAIPSPDGAAG